MNIFYQWLNGLVFGIESVPTVIANEEGDEWCVAIHLGFLRVFVSKSLPEDEKKPAD